MPSVNEMGFNQISATLNTIYQQVTGQTELAVIENTGDFISVANTVLRSGFDPILNAISQLVSKTIFSVRPYDRKFKGIFVDNAGYGAHVRKINYVDLPAVDDDAYKLVEGESMDMYKVRKPKAVQTNFYGFNTYQDYITIFRDQLKTAFTGPEQLGSFITGVMQNISDKHEQFHETMARAALLNFIGGKLDGDKSNVIHLLTEYKAATGQNDLTAVTVYQPENFRSFMQWAFSRIASISDLMTERSIKFHTNLDNGRIFMRHTPYRDQRVYLYAPLKHQATMRALADTYHENFLKLADNETVNFWQNIDQPDTVEIRASYLTASGTIADRDGVNPQANIFGVIFDREAIGISTFDQEMSSTPYNSRGRYNNIWWHFTDRYWNDFTENGVVLLLD